MTEIEKAAQKILASTEERNILAASIIAIESLVGLNGEEISWRAEYWGKMGINELKAELLDASNVINRIYRITHGLHCCTAKGREELIKTLETEGKIYHGNSENIPKFINFLKSDD